MTHILVLATGGTIASRPGTDGVAPALSGAELVEGVLADDPGLRDTLRVSVEEPFRRPSYTIGPDAMLQLARRARTALTGAYDAVVVLHGTDTVADSAWLTHLLTLPVSGGPVVFTSAMRHAAEPGADGPRNLLDALRVAAHPDAAGHGALLVVNGEIHPATRVVKSHTSALHAFTSPGASPVGGLTGTTVRFTRPPARPFADPGPVGTPAEVGVVPAWAGHGSAVIGALLDAGVQGLVVEGTGAGHVRPDAVTGLERAFALGVPVTVTSRAGVGPVHRGYGGGPGSGRWLDTTPVLDSGELGTARAQLALAVGIAAHGTGPGLADWYGQVARHQAGLATGPDRPDRRRSPQQPGAAAGSAAAGRG